MILSLDIGLNLGWAIGSPEVPFVHGTAVFSSTGSDIARLMYGVRSFIEKKIDQFDIKEGVAEAPIHIPSNDLQSLEISFGIHAVAALVFKDRGLPYKRQPMGAVRIAVLGICKAPKGSPKNATVPWIKQRAIDYCESRGLNPERHDAADAIVNLEYRCREISAAYAAAAPAPLFGRGAA